MSGRSCTDWLCGARGGSSCAICVPSWGQEGGAPRWEVRGCTWFCGDAVSGEVRGLRETPPSQARACRRCERRLFFLKTSSQIAGESRCRSTPLCRFPCYYQHVSVSKPPSEGTGGLFDPENGFLMPAEGCDQGHNCYSCLLCKHTCPKLSVHIGEHTPTHAQCTCAHTPRSRSAGPRAATVFSPLCSAVTPVPLQGPRLPGGCPGPGHIDSDDPPLWDRLRGPAWPAPVRCEARRDGPALGSQCDQSAVRLPPARCPV